MEALQGVWIFELAEAAGYESSDAAKLKAFISRQVDMARMAYGRFREDRKRRGIMVMTVNPGFVFRDVSGNRRFWPVHVGEFDLEALREDRDQLWAEAAALEAGGEELVIDRALWGDAAAATEALMPGDEWIEKLGARLAALVSSGAEVEGAFGVGANKRGEPEWQVSSDHLLVRVLGISTAALHNNYYKRLEVVMGRLGWTLRGTAMRFGGVQKRGYTRLIEGVTGATRDGHTFVTSPQILLSPTVLVTPVTHVTSVTPIGSVTNDNGMRGRVYRR
jgi:Virulence-associated protein E